VTELHERTEGLRVALVELHASREEIRQKNEELTLLATRDPLTGCLNRRAFLADSERALAAAAAAAAGQPLCAIMCDVDHFKSINDRFGHGGGDEVLKAVAKALGRGLRTGDLLGRYGGEEFCIVLPDATLAQARVIAERLRAEVEANAGSAVRHLADVKVTMSFGVDVLGADMANFAALVDRADQALYRSKQTGRNRVTAFVDMAEAAVPTGA
jgi:diguanylate cyclase (GGDEF)-like protein